ncbi:MAG: hypothetical protein OHK0029_09080 [Armatimonadaceae bacterium]
MLHHKTEQENTQSTQTIHDWFEKPTTAIGAVPVRGRGQERAFGPGWQVLTFALSTLILLAGIAIIWLVGYSVWVVLETLALLTGLPRGESVFTEFLRTLLRLQGHWLTAATGWLLDIAIVIGLLSGWGFLYLGYDRLGMLGMGMAMYRLRNKAARLSPVELPEKSWFVEVRRTNKSFPVEVDTGWLWMRPDRLLFIGEEAAFVVPRGQADGLPTVGRRWRGLGGAWVQLPLQEPMGAIRLYPRQNLARVSDSGIPAEALRDALAEWLTPAHSEAEKTGHTLSFSVSNQAGN